MQYLDIHDGTFDMQHRIGLWLLDRDSLHLAVSDSHSSQPLATQMYEAANKLTAAVLQRGPSTVRNVSETLFCAQYALPPGSLERALVVICVDMSNPHKVPHALCKWSGVAAAHVHECAGDQAQVDCLRCGVEGAVRAFRDGGNAADQNDMPLQEGCLATSPALETLLPECRPPPQYFSDVRRPCTFVWREVVVFASYLCIRMLLATPLT